MKNLILALALTCTSSLVSSLALAVPGGVTIHNETQFPVKVIIKQGDLIVDQPSARAHSTALANLPEYYRVNATALINGKKVSTEAVILDGSTDFTATMQENPDYSVTFDMQESLRSDLDSVSFTNTTNAPVQFTIFGTDSPDGYGAHILQAITLTSAFTSKLKLPGPGEGYTAYAIVNGVTTTAINIQGAGSTVNVVPNTDPTHPGTFKVIGEDIDLSR